MLINMKDHVKNILNLLFFIPYLRFAYTDYRRQKILNRDFLIDTGYTLILLMIFERATIVLHLIRFFILLIGLSVLTLLLEALLSAELLGGGDIKIIALLFLKFSLPTALSALLLSSLLAALAICGRERRKSNVQGVRSFDQKNRSIIYAPFLSSSLLAVLILQHFA